MNLQTLSEHRPEVTASGNCPVSGESAAGFCELPGGRRLAWSEYGSPQGFPLFYCHNHAGTRLEGLFFHDSARTAGFRLIAVDRPGLGLSDFFARSDQNSCAEDFLQLANHLGIRRFGLLSWGGGGAFAFALSLRAPTRVMFQISLACLPFSLAHDRSALSWYEALKRGCLRGLLQLRCRLARPGRGRSSCRRRLLEQLSLPDRKLLERPGVMDLIAGNFRESSRQGCRGPARDVASRFSRWRFDPASLQVPVQLWQGNADPLVSDACTRMLVQSLPWVECHRVPAAGHLFFLRDGDAVFRSAQKLLDRQTGAGLDAIVRERSAGVRTSARTRGFRPVRGNAACRLPMPSGVVARSP